MYRHSELDSESHAYTVCMETKSDCSVERVVKP